MFSRPDLSRSIGVSSHNPIRIMATSTNNPISATVYSCTYCTTSGFQTFAAPRSLRRDQEPGVDDRPSNFSFDSFSLPRIPFEHPVVWSKGSMKSIGRDAQLERKEVHSPHSFYGGGPSVDQNICVHQATYTKDCPRGRRSAPACPTKDLSGLTASRVLT